MSSAIALYLSPAGRIGRQRFWVATLAFLFAIAIVFVIAVPELFDDSAFAAKPTLLATVLGALMVWPFTVLSVKRFNDRAYPNWVGWLVGAMNLGYSIAPYFEFADFANWFKVTSIEWGFIIVSLLAFVFALIDNGFLRGTTGPNRYGPDPIAAPA